MGVTSGLANPPLTLIAGPQLLGFLFNWGLFGALCVQVYTYYISFPNDSKWRKSLVYILLVLEAAQVAMITNDAFQNFVYGWGSPNGFTSFNIGWFAVPLLSGIISCAVQVFFAWRIWILSKSKILPGIIVLVALCQGSAAIATGIKIKVLPIPEQGEVTRVALVWMIGSPIADILIAGSMITLLLRSRGRIPETDLLIDQLICLTIETGSATALVAVVEAILFGISPKSLLYQCPALMLTKIYSNTLLVVLNKRAFRRRTNPQESVEELTARIGYRNAPRSRNGELDLTRAIHIEVRGETVVHEDLGDIPLNDIVKNDMKLSRSVSRTNCQESSAAHMV